MAIKNLQEKFLHGLQDAYDAEHQFLEAQQEMLPQATAQTVKTLLEQHITETEQQIGILEKVFETLGESAKRAKCAGAAGIVSENETLLEEVADNPALVDLAISGGCGKVEHYEIASYRMLIIGAEQTGQTEVAQLLQTILQQEERTAQKIEQSAPALFQQAQGRAASA